MEHERAVKIARFANMVLDVSAVIGDRAGDVRTTAHEIAKLAAQAITDCADLAVALGHGYEERRGVLHVAHAEVVVEIVVEIERLPHVRRVGVRELNAGLLPPE